MNRRILRQIVPPGLKLKRVGLLPFLKILHFINIDHLACQMLIKCHRIGVIANHTRIGSLDGIGPDRT